MTQNLCKAVMTSIEALLQVPGTQLQHIESTLRQLMTDLKNANITPPEDLDILIEEAAIAHFEDAAYMNGVAWDDESYITNDMPEYSDEEAIYSNWEANGVIHPNDEMRQELDNLPW